MEYLFDVLSVPLANAGPARVCQHHAAEVVEHFGDAVALNGGPDLLGAGRDGEERL